MTYKITTRQQAVLDELKAFHYNERPSIDWKKQLEEPFSKRDTGPNEKSWNQKETQFKSTFFSSIVGINKLLLTYYRFKKNKAKKMDELAYQKWEERYPFVKNIVEGELNSWRECVRNYANFHQNSAIARAYCLHVQDSKTVECDIYLHDLSDIIPFKIEKTTKKGKLRYHDMPKTKRYELYQHHVYSCLNKIVNDLFAVLPCDTVFINGAIGSADNPQPILSAVIERNNHQQNRCPMRTIERHRQMVMFKKRSGFYPLKKVYSPQLLHPKEG
ncbi:hypothetical protein BN1058_00861 [Paraliobacillus sp. PM-2]|uniref:hypothetical protein n=1 Tax=Paraliobacillus sp. PM-2 TaxID=1462524 RepID=UPI00061BBAAA|nr:hypothetical protein [Paraliobacillus sp. PM-2]CQR46592.1 hypothetical protein BN1058_00861 [Paraliobacillus sp. PM-2]